MTDQRGYEARQNKWIENTGVKKGDRVLIASGLNVDERWSEASWVGSMDKDVGQVGRVTFIDTSGIRVRTDYDTWWYPFFVLVKVEGE
jgi:preprotein translocase subunit YajC